MGWSASAGPARWWSAACWGLCSQGGRTCNVYRQGESHCCKADVLTLLALHSTQVDYPAVSDSAAAAAAAADTSSLLQRLSGAAALLPPGDLAPLRRAVQRAGAGARACAKRAWGTGCAWASRSALLLESKCLLCALPLAVHGGALSSALDTRGGQEE